MEDSSGLFRAGEILLMCPQEEQEAELRQAVWSFTRDSKKKRASCGVDTGLLKEEGECWPREAQ